MKNVKLQLGIIFLMMFVSSALAQAEGVTEQKTTLWQMILQGGWAMIPLGLMSTAMVYFIVQNALALREKVLLRPDLLPEFVALMKDKKIVEAHTKCKEK